MNHPLELPHPNTPKGNIHCERKLERMIFFGRLKMVNFKEELVMKQKSKIKLLEKGDFNSIYFHSMIMEEN